MSAEYRGRPGNRTWEEWYRFENAWPWLVRMLSRRLDAAAVNLMYATTMASSRGTRAKVCGYDEALEASVIKKQRSHARKATENAIVALALIGALRASLRPAPPVDGWALLCAAADRFRAALSTGKPDLIRQRDLAVCRIMDEHDFGCRVTFDFVTGQVWRGGADVFDEYAA